MYPEQRSSQTWNGVFPDGVPLSKDGDKKPPYVFVWKTWGMSQSTLIFSLLIQNMHHMYVLMAASTNKIGSNIFYSDT